MSTTMTDSERLELLEAELNRLRTAREREEQAQRALYELPSLPKSKEGRTPDLGWAGELQKRQEQQRQERIRAAAEREARHAVKLDRNASKREKVRAELGVIAERQKAAQASWLALNRSLGAEMQKLSNQLAALEAYDDPVEPTSPPVSFRGAYATSPPARNHAKAA